MPSFVGHWALFNLIYAKLCLLKTQNIFSHTATSCLFTSCFCFQTCQKAQTVNSTPIAFTSCTTSVNSNSNEQTSGNSAVSSVSMCEKYSPAHSPEKINNKIDQKVIKHNLV